MHRFVGYSDLHIGRIYDMAGSVTSHLCRVYALHRDCLSLSCISLSVRFYNVRGKTTIIPYETAYRAKVFRTRLLR